MWGGQVGAKSPRAASNFKDTLMKTILAQAQMDQVTAGQASITATATASASGPTGATVITGTSTAATPGNLRGSAAALASGSTTTSATAEVR